MSNRPRYDIKHNGKGSWSIHRGGRAIAGIERVLDYPEYYTNIFGKKIQNTGKKFHTRYMITDIPGAGLEKYRSVKAAAMQAAFHHANNQNLMEKHPAFAIGHHIDALGAVIHTAAADPRMTDEDQEKLLDISKQHAALRDTHAKHFANT